MNRPQQGPATAQIERRGPLPLYYQVRELIRSLIGDEKLTPGTPLPTVREICARHEVSHITVNRALGELAAEGLIYRVQGKGSFVAEQETGGTQSVGTRPESRTGRFGLILPFGFINRPDDFYYSETLKGVRNALASRRYGVLTLSYSGAGAGQAYRTMIEQNQTDGVLVMAPFSEEEVLDILCVSGTPHVLLCGNAGDSYVDANNVAAASDATRHLMGLGHDRIGFIAWMHKWNMHSHDRLKGYKLALQEGGIPIDEKLIVSAPDVYESGGQEAIGELLKLDRPPTAVVAGGYWMAIGALDVLKRNRISVPGDLSVVSLDDPMTPQAVEPPLTTVRQPFAEIGEVAAKKLLELVTKDGARPERVVLPTELVVRGSCAAPRQGNLVLQAGSR